MEIHTYRIPTGELIHLPVSLSLRQIGGPFEARRAGAYSRATDIKGRRPSSDCNTIQQQ